MPRSEPPRNGPDRIDPTAEVAVTSWAYGADLDAPVVIAVHDLTANGLWFGDLADAVAARARVVAPDLRGRAASSSAPPAATIDDHVADLLALAHRVDAATFSLVGHGTGAMPALAAAAAAPTRVTQVVVLDGPPIARDDAATDWITAASRVDPGIMRLRQTWAHRDAAVAAGIANGRLPASGMSRSLRRAVEAEIAGSGFGWRARLAERSLERDWGFVRAWTPPSGCETPVTSLHATHGHRTDDPPIERWTVGTREVPLDTTHTGLLVDRSAVRAVAESIHAVTPQ